MLKDLVKQNRSRRGFDESRLISREELLDMVDCARICPSAMNAQPLKYALVNDPETVKALQPFTVWARRLAALHLPREGERPTAFIVICADESIRSVAASKTDVGIAAQTILLRAVEMGLGGCMIESIMKDKIQSLLGLPEQIVPSLVIGLGKPTETVVLTETDGDTGYYRDENDVHYVPKRKLEDILL